MNPDIMNDRQILGSFFAIMIVVFSFGNSYVEAKGKITEPEQQQSFSTLSEGRITPSSGNDHHADLVTHNDLYFSIYNSTGSDSKSSGRISCRTLQVNSLILTRYFLLPGIHAP